MTKTRIIALLATLSFLMVIFCSESLAVSLKEGKQKDIEMLLNAASGMNTAYWATLIGETKDRVYIEYSTIIHAGSFFSEKPKIVVFWFRRPELGNENLDKFREYKVSQEERK